MPPQHVCNTSMPGTQIPHRISCNSRSQHARLELRSRRDVPVHIGPVPGRERGCSTACIRRVAGVRCAASTYIPALERDNLQPTVDQVMNADVVCLRDTTHVREAIRIFLSKGISGAPVVGEGGRIVGVLSETDIIRTQAGLESDMVTDRNIPYHYLPFIEAAAHISEADRSFIRQLLDLQVRELMTTSPITVSPHTLVVEAAATMVRDQVNRLPVVESDGKVVGIITRGDVLQTMIWEMLVAGEETESSNEEVPLMTEDETPDSYELAGLDDCRCHDGF